MINKWSLLVSVMMIFSISAEAMDKSEKEITSPSNQTAKRRSRQFANLEKIPLASWIDILNDKSPHHEKTKSDYNILSWRYIPKKESRDPLTEEMAALFYIRTALDKDKGKEEGRGSTTTFMCSQSLSQTVENVNATEWTVSGAFYIPVMLFLQLKKTFPMEGSDSFPSVSQKNGTYYSPGRFDFKVKYQN